MLVMKLMSYSYDTFVKNNRYKKKQFRQYHITLMNTSIKTNTCMTLKHYILNLDKSEPSAAKAILSSLYTMFLI